MDKDGKTALTLAQAWRDDLHTILGDKPVELRELRVGVFYTGAQLSTGDVGVAFTPRDLVDTVCCPRSAAAGPPAGRLVGQSAWEIAEYADSRIPLRRAVGVAVLNAFSALAIARHGVLGGRLVPDLDAIEAAHVVSDDRVAMVGAFTPFIKALKGKVSSLWVVDKHPTALRADESSLWCSPSQAVETLRKATCVLITGSALVEGGLDELLQASRSARCVVLAGPTASPWPPTFFQRGVDILAGVRILDGSRVLQLVSEGGSGYVLFSKVGQKVCMVREETP